MSALVSFETMAFARYHWISYSSFPYRDKRRRELRGDINMPRNLGRLCGGVLWFPNWFSLSCCWPQDYDGVMSLLFCFDLRRSAREREAKYQVEKPVQRPEMLELRPDFDYEAVDRAVAEAEPRRQVES